MDSFENVLPSWDIDSFHGAMEVGINGSDKGHLEQ